jgi:hypothetical protein
MADISIAARTARLIVLGFTGEEVKEGIAALREKRKPSFPSEPKDF